MVEKRKKVVAFIPVRGGSKSIPLKNIKKLCGRPLVFWVIDAAIGSSEIDEVYISTDSDEIRASVEEYKSNDLAKTRKLMVVDRPAETATDTASTESALLDFARKNSFDTIVLIQATSPLLSSTNLDEALSTYTRGTYDSLLSVVRQKRFVWDNNESGARPVNYDYNNRPRRQEFDGYLVENGAFYVTSREALLSSECRLSGEIGIYEMSEDTYYEIDEPDDWVVVEELMKRRQADNQNMDSIRVKLLAMDCDGVLTDGGMYYTDSGDEFKRFNTVDGMGISILKKAGIKAAIITGENTHIVENRAKKIGVDYLYQGIKDKLAVLKEIASLENVALEEIAYIGDDINDLKCLSSVGISFTVPNAVNEAKEAATVVLSKKGGEGAVREAIEYILKRCVE